MESDPFFQPKIQVAWETEFLLLIKRHVHDIIVQPDDLTSMKRDMGMVVTDEQLASSFKIEDNCYSFSTLDNQVHRLFFFFFTFFSSIYI